MDEVFVADRRTVGAQLGVGRQASPSAGVIDTSVLHFTNTVTYPEGRLVAA